jgi:4-amino-4-deoxy-L-arabinose transferase-like glycosyltransferase
VRSVCNRTVLSVLVVTLMAALIRLPSLLHGGLWRDDAYVYVDLSAPTLREFFHRVMETESHPPLYFAIAYVWAALFGMSERALTSLPFLTSLLTVPVLYAIGRMLAGPLCGTLAAAIFAVSPFAVAYSTEYLYPLAALVVMILAWALILIRQKGTSPVRLAGVGIASALVVYVHYVGLIYVAAMIVWVLITSKTRQAIHTAVAIGVGALTFTAWLPILMRQQQLGLPWQLPSGFGGKASFIASVISEAIPARPAYLEYAFACCILVAAIALWRADALEDCAIGLAGVFIAVLLCLAFSNLLQIRYVYPVYGLACIFFGWALSAGAERLRAARGLFWRRFGLGSSFLLCALFLVGDIQYANASTRLPKSGIRTFVMAQHPNADTLYVVAPDYTGATLFFYLQGASAPILGFARVEHPEIFRIDGYRSIWNDPFAVEQTLKAIERMRRHYRYLDVVVDEPALNTNGRMPYGKTRELLRALKGRYRVSGRTSYDGRHEPVSVYRFVLE